MNNRYSVGGLVVDSSLSMATLHLICGLPCSGKTTLAKELEQEHSALRLTPDEWHIRLFGQDANDNGYYDDVHTARHSAIEAMLWQIAARVLSLGIDVILDFGFWFQDERQMFRDRAEHLGVQSQFYYLVIPGEELLERLEKRNEALPSGAFVISPEQMKSWIPMFEPPSEDELKLNGHGWVVHQG